MRTTALVDLSERLVKFIDMRKVLTFVFGFEIAAMILAFVIFKAVPDRTLAAMIAGSGFVALGATIFGLGLKSREFRKTFTFWLGSIHLFAISLPVMGSRIASVDVDFSSLLILGMFPGPVFHRLSEMFYVVLVLGTVVDRVLSRSRERQNKNGGQ